MHDDIVSKIQQHFIAKGWQPLLRVTIDGLQAMGLEPLQQLLGKVKAEQDRGGALTAILEALARAIQAS